MSAPAAFARSGCDRRKRRVVRLSQRGLAFLQTRRGLVRTPLMLSVSVRLLVAPGFGGLPLPPPPPEFPGPVPGDGWRITFSTVTVSGCAVVAFPAASRAT